MSHPRPPERILYEQDAAGRPSCLSGRGYGPRDADHSLATLLPLREDVGRDPTRLDRHPFDREAPTIAEEAAPDLVPNVDRDAEAGHPLIVPFANVGDSAEGHREVEGHRPLVEPLGART